MIPIISNLRASAASACQRGYSLLELTLVVAVIAGIAIIAVVAFTDTQGSVDRTRAFNELNSVVTSARQYRSTFAQGGLYTNITMGELAGYNLAGMEVTGTNARNAYDEDATIVPRSGNADATITYPTGDQDTCDAILDLFIDAPGILGSPGPTCVTGTLTIHID